MGRRPGVLVLTLMFPPDGVSSAQLMGEIVEALAARGHSVRVITTSPHYNVDELAQQNQPIRWRWHRLIGSSCFAGLEVLHLRMPKKAAGRFARSAQWAWFHVGTGLLALRHQRDYGAILVNSPPPTVALVAALLKWFTGAKTVYAIWELYPEIAVRLGHLKRDGLLHKALRLAERWTYRWSDEIAVLHAPMADAVLSVAPSVCGRVSIVPTFADTGFLAPDLPDTELRASSGLAGKFVVGYAGNLGISQNLEPVLLAAKELQGDPNIAFLVVGDGSDEARLRAVAHELGLTNVTFAGYLPYQRVPEIYATFDVSLVVLSDGVAAEALPSKVYRTMSCGRPVLAITDSGSPLDLLVSDERVGLTASPCDPSAIAEQILRLARHETMASEMGARGRLVVESRFSRPVVVDQIEALLVEGDGVGLKDG